MSRTQTEVPEEAISLLLECRALMEQINLNYKCRKKDEIS